MAQMIANSSRPGEIVYDPFCGSGSTIVAAAQLNVSASAASWIRVTWRLSLSG